MSIAQGLSLQKIEEAKRIAGVDSSMVSKDRIILNLEAKIESLLKERVDTKREVVKARDDLGLQRMRLRK